MKSLFGRRPRRRVSRPTRTRRLLLESLENRFLLSAQPLVTLDVPQSAFIGSDDVVIRATFDNQGASIGYGPFIDIVFPVNGADGDPEDPTEIKDGISPISGATYLGQSVTTTELVFPNDQDGFGCVTHPYAVDEDGPLQVCGPAGDILVVVQLPFGSFTPDQPEVTIEIEAELHEFADLGVGLPFFARGGFQFGLDPLNNPSTDPTILTGGSEGSDFSTWGEDAEVIPTVMTMDKTYIGPENETATGPNFPRQYELTVNIAPGQTIENLQIIDGFDNNIVVTGIEVTTTHDPPPINIPAVPFGPAEFDFDDDEKLVAEIPEVEGTGADDVIVLIDFYVPEFDANGHRIIPLDGDHSGVVTLNTARAQGGWLPLDERDWPVPGNEDELLAVSSDSEEHKLDNKSIAIQKSVAVVDQDGNAAGSAAPGKFLQYTLEFQVSDYYTFGDLFITDTFSDGQNFFFDDDPNEPVFFTPTFTISDRRGTTSGDFVLGETLFHTFDGELKDETETLVFHVSEALEDASNTKHPDGILIGGLATADDDFKIPPENVGREAAALGTVTFRVLIPNDYELEQPAGNQYLAQGDTLTNDAWIEGTVRNNDNTDEEIGEEGDDTSASVRIPVGQLQKSIHAVNGEPPSEDFVLAPGDELTYCLVYTKPITSFNNLELHDWLPLPVFDVTDPLADGLNQAWQFNEVSVDPDPNVRDRETPPAAGYFQLGPLDTLYDKTGESGNAFFNPPVITADGTGNSLTFTYGSFDSEENTEETLHILFTITASDHPFADGLFLTNIVRAVEDNSQGKTSIEDAIVQFPLGQPALNISKGVVATDYPESGGTFTPVFEPATVGPVDFNPPGSEDSFDAPITSAGLAANPINSNLRNIDAGNLVTFAIVVENTGSSRKGAFDIEIKDTLPDGFDIPGDGDLDGLNLSVTDGTGADIDWVRVDTSDTFEMALFGAGIELVDPDPPDEGDHVGALAQYDADNGLNILIVTYDLIALDTVEPNQVLENTATLLAYAGAEDAENHVDGNNPPKDDAQVTIASPQIEKTIFETNQDHTANLDVAIGEIITYQVVITVPEGTMTDAKLVDELDSGLAFVKMVSIEASDDLSTSIGDFNAVADNVDVSYVDSDTVVNQGRRIELDFGTITNSNTDDTVTETIVVTYEVVVLNSDNNTRGQQRNNRAEWQWEPDFGLQSIEDSAPDVVIVEPTLEVVKTASPEEGEAGDVITFTIVVGHITDSNADAFDVELTDVIPAGMTYVDGSLKYTGVEPDDLEPVLQESGGTISATWDTFAEEASSTFEFQVTLDVSVVPGEEIVNSAEIFYSSLPDVVDDPQSDHNDLSTERTGDPEVDGSTASYRDDDDATVTIFTPIAVDKSIVATSEPHTDDSDVAIGEIVRYGLEATIIRGTNPGYRIVDTLPEGLKLIDYGSNGDPNEVTVQFIAEDSITNGDPWDLAGANGDAPIPMPVGRINVDGQKITFDFGTLVNENTGEDGPESVILEFNVLVLNTADNEREDDKANQFEVYVDEVLQDTSDPIDVTIVEPELEVIKAADPDEGDAFDTITFTITVQHSEDSDADAFNVELTDVIPVGMNYVDGSLDWISGEGTGLSFSETEQKITAEWASFPQEQDGDPFESQFQFSVTLDVSVQPGQEITNTADLTYTSLPDDGTPVGDDNPTGSATPGGSGEGDGQRDGSGGVNDYAASDDQDVTIIDPEFTKTLTATSQTTPLTDVTIGEILTYEIVITVPEGTMPDVLVVDELDDGLAIVDVISMTLSDSAKDNLYTTFGTDSGDPPQLLQSVLSGITTAAVSTIPEGPDGGGSISFDFGTLINEDDDNEAPETITIVYRAVVLNTLENDRDTPLDNAAELTWGEDDLTGQLEAAGDTVTIVEPELKISKTAEPDEGEAGDEITFTIVVQHSDDSNADSFDVVLTDEIPADMIFDRFLDHDEDYVEPDSLLQSGGTITATWNSLSPGDVSQFQFVVTLDISVVPGQEIVNSADIFYSSLPGDVNDPQSDFNDLSTERTGDPGVDGSTASYRDDDDATVTIFTPIAVDKSIVATSEPHTDDSDVAIGEIVRYRLEATIIRGTNPAYQIIDTLPDGLQLIDYGKGDDPNLVTVEFVSTNPITTTDAEPNPWDLDDANEDAIAMPSDRIDVDAQKISFDFGTLVNENTGEDRPESVILEFNVLVLNTASNQRGDEKSNQFDVYVADVLQDTSEPVEVTIVEPELIVTKEADVNTGDAFDTITFTITVQHSEDSDADAFNVELTDVIPVGMNYVDGSLTWISGDGTELSFSETEQKITAEWASFPQEQDGEPFESRFEFQVILDVSVEPEQVLTNTATVTYTSLPGNGTPAEDEDNPTGSSTPGESGSETGQRDDSENPEHNDYIAQDSNDFTILSPTFTKILLETSQDYTDDPELTIGEEALFQLELTVPEGTMPGVTITDVMPSGLEFLKVESIATSPGLSFNAFNLTSSPTGFSLDLGTITNTDTDNEVTETVTIVYRARVLDVPANVSGQQRTNDAVFEWTGGEIEDAVTVEIVEPDLEIAKEADVSHVDRGDTVTFTITVSHTDDSTAAAQAVTITDVLPAGLSYDGNLTAITDPPPTETVDGQTLSFSWSDIPLDAGPYVFSFDVTVDATVPLGEDLVNTAQLVWSTLPGANLPDDRTYSDSDQVGLTVNVAIGNFVWKDLNGDGIQDAGEPGIEGVTVNLLDGAGDPVLDGDNNPITTTTDSNGFYEFSGLPPGDYAVQFEPPPGYVFSPQDADGQGVDGPFNSDADPDTGITPVVTLVSGEINHNVDAGLYEPITIGDFVWNDLDGDGIQGANEPGIKDVTVNLLDADGNVIDTTTTDGDGFYEFTDVAPGTYSVQFVAPDDFVFTNQTGVLTDGDNSDADENGDTAQFTVQPGDTIDYVDAGLYEPIMIGDFVWNDLDGDGIQDAGEPGIEGVTVNLLDADGNAIDTTTTDGGGFYQFTGLPPGTYSVQVVLPAGYFFSPQNADGTDFDDPSNSVVDPTTGKTPQFTLESGDMADYVDAGLVEEVASIELVKTGELDDGSDGFADEGDVITYTFLVTNTGNVTLFDVRIEDPLPGLSPLIPASLASLAPGMEFEFTATYALTLDDLEAGEVENTATVRAETPGGDPDDPEDDITATDGTSVEYVVPASLSGTVYIDVNNNGQRDPGEIGIPGVTVWLVGEDTEGNTVQAPVVTDADGNFQFIRVPPGTYSLIQVQPAEFIDGKDTPGTVDGQVRGEVETTDVIVGIELDPNDAGVGYLFGERGLRNPSKRQLLTITGDPGILDREPGSGVTDVLAAAPWETEVVLDELLTPQPFAYADTLGIYDPGRSLFHLHNAIDNVFVDVQDVRWRSAPRNWRPLMGNWNGDGGETTGFYDPRANEFYLNNALDDTNQDLIEFAWPERVPANWLPVVGDWNGDGRDTVGLYDPRSFVFYLTMEMDGTLNDVEEVHWRGPSNRSWLPIAGDWNPDEDGDSIGLYDSRSNTFYLSDTWDENDTSDPQVVHWSGAGRGWLPVIGDWNKDGQDTLGLYDARGATFHLINSLEPDSSEPITHAWSGAPRGAVPLAAAWDEHGYTTVGLYDPRANRFLLNRTVHLEPLEEDEILYAWSSAHRSWPAIAGDWNNDGTDTVGLYDSRNGVFHLALTLDDSPDVVQIVWPGANRAWLPIAGDWNEDGADSVGLYDTRGGVFHLAPTIDFTEGVIVVADVWEVSWSGANRAWLPIAGDWNGDGTDTIGLYDTRGRTFYLRNGLDGPDTVVNWEGPHHRNWRPVAGDWNGDGWDTVGLYDAGNGTFYLINSHMASADETLVYHFGSVPRGTMPLAGNWDGSNGNGANGSDGNGANGSSGNGGEGEAAWLPPLPIITPSSPEAGDSAGPASGVTDTDGSGLPASSRFDVNGDGRVTPADVLFIINELNRSTTEGSGDSLDLRADVSGDGWVTALDALLVINHLNASQAAADGGEPEAASELIPVAVGPQRAPAEPPQHAVFRDHAWWDADEDSDDDPYRFAFADDDEDPDPYGLAYPGEDGDGAGQDSFADLIELFADDVARQQPITA